MRMSRWFAAPLAAVLVGPLLAAPAWAHDSLVASNPPDGAVLDAAPSEIALEFTGNILELNPALQVTDADGEQVEVGEAKIEDSRVTWELLGPVDSGEFAVVWAVTSQDGHPIDGDFTFAVEAAPAEVEPEATETTQTTEPEAAEPPDSAAPSPSPTAENGSDISRSAEMWFFAGLVVTVIAVVVVALVARRNRDPNGPPGQH